MSTGFGGNRLIWCATTFFTDPRSWPWFWVIGYQGSSHKYSCKKFMSVLFYIPPRHLLAMLNGDTMTIALHNSLCSPTTAYVLWTLYKVSYALYCTLRQDPQEYWHTKRCRARSTTSIQMGPRISTLPWDGHARAWNRSVLPNDLTHGVTSLSRGGDGVEPRLLSGESTAVVWT